jgi:hypothetical protein
MCADVHALFVNKENERWKSTSNEKFDKYLGKHGLGLVVRKSVNSMPCHVTITKNEDGTWTVKEETYVRTAISTYALDVRHQTVHPVTQKVVTAIVTVEDGKVIGKCFEDENSEVVTEWTSREMKDGKMVQIIYFGDLVCTREFVRES